MYQDNLSPKQQTAGISSKMSAALAEAWNKGERKLVKSTIDCGLDAETRRQWKDDTANALPADQRETFLQYMRG